MASKDIGNAVAAFMTGLTQQSIARKERTQEEEKWRSYYDLAVNQNLRAEKNQQDQMAMEQRRFSLQQYGDKMALEAAMRKERFDQQKFEWDKSQDIARTAIMQQNANRMGAGGGGSSERYVEPAPGVKIPATSMWNSLVGSGMSFNQSGAVMGGLNSDDKFLNAAAKQEMGKAFKPKPKSQMPEDPAAQAKAVFGLLGEAQNANTTYEVDEMGNRRPVTVNPELGSVISQGIGGMVEPLRGVLGMPAAPQRQEQPAWLQQMDAEIMEGR